MPIIPTTEVRWYAGIVVAVVLFNLVAIFGADGLLHDDPFHYGMMIHGEFGVWARGWAKFNAVGAMTEWLGAKLMVWSPFLARGFYVMALMVPISGLLYYFYSARLGFPRATAFAAAVLPNILPQQSEIPAGINMSYVVWGLLAALVSFLLALRYLEDTRTTSWRWLVRAGLVFLVATQITEQALFLYPSVVLALALCSCESKKKWRLGGAFTLVAATKVAQILLLPRLQPASLAVDEIGYRAWQYLDWSLPIPRETWAYAIGLLAMIGVAVAALRRLRPAPASASPRPGFTAKCLAVCLCWSLSTILVFLLSSQWYTVRYAYYSAFGLTAALALLLETQVVGLFGSAHAARAVIFGSLVVFSGLLRYEYLRDEYSGDNAFLAVIRRDVGSVDLPPMSQVVIAGNKSLGGGWYRSSGTLEYALRRPDVFGLIGAKDEGAHFNFDDHFDPRARGYSEDMTGLSLDAPTFLFVADRGGTSLRRLDLALQWKGSTDAAAWKILRMDRVSGKASPLAQGIGMSAYTAALRELEKSGVRQSDILWGGPPTQAERVRLLDTRDPMRR
jgi:hypothetical protein